MVIGLLIMSLILEAVIKKVFIKGNHSLIMFKVLMRIDSYHLIICLQFALNIVLKILGLTCPNY